ncbi:MAG: LacI family DNA-binding transcriptional regulator [Candidatus Microbacterium stercoravium]
MATLSDVAARAGVSVSAVSRVLSDAPETRVSDETRERIKRAARELDYRPNSAGRALRSARSNVVALVVPDLMNAIFIELVRGVEDAAIQHDYLVLMGRTEDIEPGDERARKLLGEGRVDALLLQPGDRPHVVDAIAGFAETKPVVILNSVEANAPGSATMPDEAGARTAVRHLIELGHEKIGFVGGVPENPTNARRASGFRSEMAAAGLEVDEGLTTDFGYTPDEGVRAAEQLLSGDRRPTAIFVANVNAAIGVLSAARRLGVSVPEDLSVVALHDSWTAENSWPPLTTVKMPWYELGQRAFDEVYRRIRGETPTSIVVDDPAPRLIVRESTARPRAPRQP